MTSKKEFYNHIVRDNTFEGEAISLGAATLNQHTLSKAFVKVLTSATFIRAVFGILKKVV